MERGETMSERKKIVHRDITADSVMFVEKGDEFEI